jgi:Zn-dependent protease/CBS domain-containing protein
MKTAFQIGRIIGIPIQIHFTFLIILGLFVWVFSIESITILGFTIGFGGLPASLLVKILFALVLSVLFFACVLLHELGHSYVTQKNGYKINAITLFIFGGMSQMEDIPREPALELKIAIIGPLTSFLLGVVFYLFFKILDIFNGMLVLQGISITLGTLAFYNVLLGGFNLIPAFPTDGGRVLRSVFAMFMDYEKATKAASYIGRGVSVAMAIFGIFIFNFWLVLIAIFIFFGAAQEEKSVQISLALEGVKVKDIMTSDIETVPPDMTISDLYEFMYRHKHLTYPVVEDENVVGVATFGDVQQISKDRRKSVLVKDVMRKDSFSIPPEEDAVTAFKVMMRKNIDMLIVKYDKKVEGIISRSDIIRAVEMRTGRV